jgi:Fe-S cluster assembly ATP-binding protein
MHTKQTILEIADLHVNIDQTPLLKGINLTIQAGGIHAIMGPNGSGKSTLALTLAKKPGYTITNGTISFLGENIQNLSIEACAHRGLFLGFQNPVAIPGLSTVQFLKAALNAQRKAQGKPPLDAVDCLSLIKEKMQVHHIPESWLSRSFNEGFSGGEKKRNELLQLSLLEPKLAILDEIDSGLDIDALKMIAQGLNALRSENRAMLLITHYQRLLDLVEPDFVHILLNGKIVESGDKQLAKALEKKGYGYLSKQTSHES